ncbi:coiled-coil domain-containing protein 9-like isoform X2 [Patiria miniata]|uniref:PDZ domain-containing protein n=1 Tax=Patiria miniata TaxID=46514 RepID=A0A914BMX2_PATMI|nr:coiled-coil domain-containing protein 9-like isoform X2 [Patiria miniata]
MSSNIHLEVASNQLRQDLSQIVDNFTLLDILSKEEQELVLETKISSIKRKNEERMRRHQEIEEDKLQASREGSTVSSPSSLMSQTPPPDQTMNSPVQQSTSPSWDSGAASLASSIDKHGEDSSGGWDQGNTGWKDAWEGERGTGSGGAKRRQDAPQPTEPSSVKSHTETVEIDLHTEGKGLGFGVMNFPGIGVTVKTILPDGVAGKDGRLHSGDLLLQINDTNVEAKSLNEVYAILKQCQGDVRLVVSREIMEVSRGPPSQRREGQRRGPPKDTSSRPKKENDRMEREPKVKRKVVMRGGNQEDLTISVETEPSKPIGRGSRGRGRTVRVSRDDVKRKDFEEKRKENFDRVEAEIAALREALENEKAAGTVNPPSKSVYSFLDDPSRYGADPQQERPSRGNRQDRGRRNQRSRGGLDGENAAGRRKDQRGRGGSNHGQRGADLNAETTVTMTGKERHEYEEWKREREKIDQERIRRHQEATTRQETRWKPEDDRDTENKATDNQQASQGEMRIGHWEATDSVPQQRERRTGGSHFEHDDRMGDQRSQHNSRIGSGRFTPDSNQRGRGGGRGLYQGGRGQDQGRRGRGGYDRGGSRPGRRSGPSDRELSQMDIRTLTSPQQESEKSFQESPIGQWQPTSGEDWGVKDTPPPVKQEGGTSQDIADKTESLHIGPLPSPSGGDDCKSPLSPLSPFTPTGHTFLTDWAAETEARSAQGFDFQADLVYSNSNTQQGS